MKRAAFLFIFLALTNFTLFAQESEKDLRLFDSIAIESTLNDSCEHLLNRLGNLMVVVNENPDAVGYVVIYGGRNEIRNKLLERFVNGFFRQNGNAGQKRFVVLTAESGDRLKIDYWISNTGKTRPEVQEVSYDFKFANALKPITLFRDTVQIVKADGQWSYINWACAACCIEVFHPDLLTDYLKSNPLHTAQINIYGRSRS